MILLVKIFFTYITLDRAIDLTKKIRYFRILSVWAAVKYAVDEYTVGPLHLTIRTHLDDQAEYSRVLSFGTLLFCSYFFGQLLLEHIALFDNFQFTVMMLSVNNLQNHMKQSKTNCIIRFITETEVKLKEVFFAKQARSTEKALSNVRLCTNSSITHSTKVRNPVGSERERWGGGTSQNNSTLSLP